MTNCRVANENSKYFSRVAKVSEQCANKPVDFSGIKPYQINGLRLPYIKFIDYQKL
jgi:hypothetical protein